MNHLSHAAGKTMLLLAALCFFVESTPARCQGAEAQAQTTAITVQQMAVMPFVRGTTEAQKKEDKLDKTLDCQFRSLCVFDEDIFPADEDVVTRLVQTELRRKFNDKMVPLARVRETYGMLEKETTDTPLEVAVRLGQSLGVDHVLVGLVWRYQERVGSAMAATDPASVAFSLFMVDVTSQKRVWKGSFRKTQTSLSENLLDAPLFLKTGMKWLTAEELSNYGVKKILKQLSIQ
ncbi:MAG: hypothetical protein PF442_13455 [Desulfobulbaceae bacterium]|jgi:hypothetical protein|nr:hypothetical protein [Desulfobulbaceae bacterium]